MRRSGIVRAHHRLRSTAGLLGVLTPVGYWLPSTTLVSAPARRLFGVRATVECPDAVVLTFDDGPHPEGTRAVLAALAEASAHATFFLVGEQVERHPDVAAEIVAVGHEVGLHCQRHRNLMRLTPRQVRADLDRAAEVIRDATGREVRLYRPPYGILTAPALGYARRAGWDVVLWRRDGKDWQARATADSIATKILQRLLPGDVVLLHDADHYSAPESWRDTARALPLLLGELARRELRTAPLAQVVDEPVSR
jgi:peptidoglycan/xylan/chitin deacetylase (PgdA/CDA1 family)